MFISVSLRIKAQYALISLFLLLLVSALAIPCRAQDAQLSGTITDSSNAAVSNATVDITNTATLVKSATRSNSEGRYLGASLVPGTYEVTVQAPNFETQLIRNISLNVASKVSLNFVLRPGKVEETVTVDESGLQLNTTDANVSTVIDHQFVEDLPLNGRSFQSLMTITPGVAVVPSSGVGQSGELSVNGQRTESNYFMVDGVSANTGASVSSSGSTGAGFTGATPGETALGTTQSMVSIDALQEFRVLTSSYSAEYGRIPGGQFAFNTRSGTNQFHGTAVRLSSQRCIGCEQLVQRIQQRSSRRQTSFAAE